MNQYTKYSGTGRKGDKEMRLLSLYESGDSDGSVSLGSLFTENKIKTSLSNVDLDTLINLIVKGGWPSLINEDVETAMRSNSVYFWKGLDYDLRNLNDGNVDSVKLRLFIKTLARNESNIVSDRQIIRDMEKYENDSITQITLSNYSKKLGKLTLTADQPAFVTNLKTTTRVGKSPKRHLIDPSLAVAAMEYTPEKLKNDLNTFGLLFEALCERDLDIYAESLGGKLFHYRDDRGNEINAVVEMPDGSWGAFEIKLGTNQIDKAAEHLLSMSGKFEKPPKVLGVICGLSEGCYTRKDGVHVFPITALKN